MSNIKNNEIDSLRNLLNGGNLNETDTAVTEELLKKYLEKFIENEHRYAISHRKDGRWATKVKLDKNNFKFIGANTRAELLNKLYDYYSKDSATMEGLYPDWLNDKRSQFSSQTIDRNRQDWNKYLAGHDIVRKPIKELRAADWVRFSKEIVGNQKMKRRAYKNVKTVASGILDFAVLNDLVQFNVLKSINHESLNFLPDVKEKNDCFTVDEYARLMSYLMVRINNPVDDAKYCALAIIQLCTGMRIGEAKALRWEDYDSHNYSINVHRSVVYRRESPDKPKRMIEQPYTKGRSSMANRIIPLTDEAVIAFNFLKGIAIETFGDIAVYKDDALIISNKAGGFIDTNKYNRWLKYYCKEAGITGHTSHDTRRFVISKMFEEGLDAYTIQHMAGHLNFSTTQGYERDIKYKRDLEKVRSALGRAT